MKPAFLRSVGIGIAAMILVAALTGGIGVSAMGGKRPILVNIAGSIMVIYCAMPIGVPILLVLITLMTWFATRSLSTGLNGADAKKQVMISVWVSTTIATLPLQLSFVIIYYYYATISTDSVYASGAGEAMFYLAFEFILLIFLVVFAGLAARLLVKNQMPSGNSS